VGLSLAHMERDAVCRYAGTDLCENWLRGKERVIFAGWCWWCFLTSDSTSDNNTSSECKGPACP
jgi:hypothetical protein